MHYFLKKGFVLILFLIFFLYPSQILADDFTTDYEVNYYLEEGSNGVESSVEFNIRITNKTSTVYVKKFGISFPNNFQIKNIKAQDDRGVITPVVTSESKSNRIELEFTNPNIGKNTVNNFNLQFNQDNLFKINGNVWEVILPTIENKGDSNYKITVHLPNNNNRKISIAKPNPDLVTGNQIIWNNPKTKTVYAVFGESQYYESELIYHLINPKLTPVYTEVAFPPDTLFQKIYISSINPKPNLTYLDEDGNFMGRYYLNPKENKTVRFKGTIEVFVKPRQSMLPYIQSKIEDQKKYLFNETKYWKLSDFNQIASLKNPQEIYEFTRDTFEYDYDKLEGDNERLGAELALKNPTKAVCVEFSDLFIAISREKGIPSREIQGYGLSQDPQLRPLSLTADILHSWPEYFDSISKQWKPVDPTWENTSGIDYFSSFDLNHIVFAIHGKRPDYPLPAGMYKQEDSQDILIKATKNIPEEYDIALYYLNWKAHYGRDTDEGKYEMLDGTVFWRNNEKNKIFIKELIELSTEKGIDHQKTMAKMLDAPESLINVFPLPRTYSYLSTKPDGSKPAIIIENPVIVHHQMSRQARKSLYNKGKIK